MNVNVLNKQKKANLAGIFQVLYYLFSESAK